MTTTIKSGKNGKATQGKAGKGHGREVIYPRVDVLKRWAGEEGPITPGEMKEMVGYTLDQKEAKAAGVTEPLYTDLDGNPVFFTKNPNNRPFYEEEGEKYAQDLLNKRWAGPSGAGFTVNGETMIFSEYGNLHSGQHQAFALLRAEEYRSQNPDKWRSLWGDGPVVMDKLVVVGVSEAEEVVNTIDTAKKRTGADVLYRLPLWGRANNATKKRMAAILESAVKFVWSRTGMAADAFSPYRTNAEVADFVERHPKLLKCVEHITQENGDKNRIGQYFSPGYAAGLMYLMAASKSDHARYSQQHPRVEKKADLSMLPVAAEFWADLVNPDSDTLKAARYALGALKEGGSTKEKTAVLIKAWGLYSTDAKVTPKGVRLVPVDEPGSDYSRSESNPDIVRFVGKYSLGGVDAVETEAPGLDPVEVEGRARAERRKSEEGRLDETARKRKAKIESLGDEAEDEGQVDDEDLDGGGDEESAGGGFEVVLGDEYEEVIVEDDEEEEVPAGKGRRGKR